MAAPRHSEQAHTHVHTHKPTLVEAYSPSGRDLLLHFVSAEGADAQFLYDKETQTKQLETDGGCRASDQ